MQLKEEQRKFGAILHFINGLQSNHQLKVYIILRIRAMGLSLKIKGELINLFFFIIVVLQHKEIILEYALQNVTISCYKIRYDIFEIFDIILKVFQTF